MKAGIAAGTPPLWLAADAYAGRLLANDNPPWLDSAEYIAWHRKATSLLKPGVAAFAVAPVVAAWIDHDAATLEAMRAIQPQVTAVLTSGYDVENIHQRYAQEGFAAFIRKPFQVETLMKVVRQLCTKA